MFQNKSKQYVFLRSDDSSDVYPNNKAYHFKTHLNSPLAVRGGWSGGAMVLGKLPVPGRPTI